MENVLFMLKYCHLNTVSNVFEVVTLLYRLKQMKQISIVPNDVILTGPFKKMYVYAMVFRISRPYHLLISFVADCLHLQLYRDSKERYKQGHTKASLSLQHFLAIETGKFIPMYNREELFAFRV